MLKGIVLKHVETTTLKRLCVKTTNDKSCVKTEYIKTEYD